PLSYGADLKSAAQRRNLNSPTRKCGENAIEEASPLERTTQLSKTDLGGTGVLARARLPRPRQSIHALPASISFTVQSRVLIAATFWLRSHETNAISPPGAIKVSCGAAGTLIVFATLNLARSITATPFAFGIAISSHLPSGVDDDPYPSPGKSIQRSTLLVFASITASRGFSVSEVNTQRPSGETEIRCTWFATGITVIVFFATMSSTETDPGPTFAVYPRPPSG